MATMQVSRYPVFAGWVFQFWYLISMYGKNGQILFIFTPTWGNDPIWLIFFKWVETTNQTCMHVFGFANRTSWGCWSTPMPFVFACFVCEGMVKIAQCVFFYSSRILKERTKQDLDLYNTIITYVGIYKKPRPFNHIFGGDRILRAWYRGIKNAGPRKRAQGRAQDTPYHIISPYHNGIWRIFIECGKKPHARKSAQGRSARGPILPKSNRNFRQPPCHIIRAYVPKLPAH